MRPCGSARNVPKLSRDNAGRRAENHSLSCEPPAIRVPATPEPTAEIAHCVEISPLFRLPIWREPCLHMEPLYPTGYLHCNPWHVRRNGFGCLPDPSTVQGLLLSPGVLPCSTSPIL